MPISFGFRYVLKQPLWATCEKTNETLGNCSKNFDKFLPLMGIDPKIMGTTKDSAIKVANGLVPRSRYVCSSYGAAGLGMINDHGMKKHGYEREDYEYSFNIGKGPIFHGFRNFMMENLKLDPSKPVSSNPPFVITISLNSTDDEPRMTNFDKQIKAINTLLEERGLASNVFVRTVILKNYPIRDQVLLVAESAVMIGVCGGGAVTNMFLPDGAGMIIFYPDVNNSTSMRQRYPARLDWDFFNNFGNARVHWLPMSSMNENDDLSVLQHLLLSEIDLISQNAFK